MIECEITETAMMTDPEQAALTFNALRDLGLKFAVDDFGTGYSSLAYLKRFPIDRLKIDRSFIHGLPDHETNRAIVTAILAMAHRLDIAVLAEGVETLAELAFLRHIGAPAYQGFLASQPLPAAQIEQILRESGKRRSYMAKE
jgi:EAL domain-containing protein (putative c-di-GMP-specific phosphodiesterase class I)